MRQKSSRPLARLQQVFPYALQATNAAHELKLDDNSKVLFIPLRAGGVVRQVWRAGMARDGHGYLLAGSGMLSETEMGRLIDSMVLRRRVA
jgi:hypothetical protein